ncbi:MAG: tRNA-dihydrouridine synthase family protein [Desulfamplus sp.]|nr:tRNA-dihydrouridine synthase family protein [Desulfamplus sp.]
MPKPHLLQNLMMPITIRGKEIPNKFFLAPMAGLGHVAFRELVAEFGGFGLLFTGMCSARAIPCENPKISKVFTWREEELPWLVCQIFGSDPASMADAARRVQEEGFFGIDLNFGCCAAAICKRGSGAALLKNPDLAAEIVFQVRSAVNIPLFVKFRTGWDNAPESSARMATLFENAGADALVFHPRVAPDRRARPPKWQHIRYVKDAVSIPVFGNGNIFNARDCRKITMESGCDGVSIGRMAVAKPWIFAALTSDDGHPNSDMKTWEKSTQSKFNTNHGESPNIYHYTASRIVDLLLKHNDEKTAVKMFKKFVPCFAANFKFGHKICQRLLKGDDPHAIYEIIHGALHPLPETTAVPNLNLFS